MPTIQAYPIFDSNLFPSNPSIAFLHVPRPLYLNRYSPQLWDFIKAILTHLGIDTETGEGFDGEIRNHVTFVESHPKEPPKTIDALIGAFPGKVCFRSKQIQSLLKDDQLTRLKQKHVPGTESKAPDSTLGDEYTLIIVMGSLAFLKDAARTLLDPRGTREHKEALSELQWQIPELETTREEFRAGKVRVLGKNHRDPDYYYLENLRYQDQQLRKRLERVSEIEARRQMDEVPLEHIVGRIPKDHEADYATLFEESTSA